MAILPLPPSGVAFIDPITGGVSVQWQNYLLSLSTIGGGFAPIDAEYWVSTANSDLTNETNLGALTTGYLKLTVAAAVGTPSTVTSIPGTDITGAALTKTDDMNVTLTLGGTPASALLRAVSLTLGWTGTLAHGRGGTDVTSPGTSGNVLTSNGTNWTSAAPATAGTVTSVAATVPGGFSISGSPVTSAGTLAIAANGTSGGVLAYTAANATASSGALAANALTLGGGAGVVPFTDSNWTIEQTSHSLSSTTQPRCVAFNSAAQAIANATSTALTLDSEDLDVGGMHSTVTNTSRVTIPAGGAGLYYAVAAAHFGTSAGTVNSLSIAKNGTSVKNFNQVPGAVIGPDLGVSWMGNLAAADFLEATVFQDSGGSMNVGSTIRGSANTLSVVKLW